MQRKPLSLCAQALAWLAQRDHSERELRRKLRLRVRAEQAGEAGGARATAGSDPGFEPDTEPGTDTNAQVEQVIGWLRARCYLDDARFVASRVDVREGRFGLARIQHELARHGVSLPAEQAQHLRSTEFERAQALWQRRFGQVAADPREAARQARFLAGRGFSSEVVRQVLRLAGRAAAPG